MACKEVDGKVKGGGGGVWGIACKQVKSRKILFCETTMTMV